MRVGGGGGGVDEFAGGGEGVDFGGPGKEGFAGIEGGREVFFVLGVRVSAGLEVSACVGG